MNSCAYTMLHDNFIFVVIFHCFFAIAMQNEGLHDTYREFGCFGVSFV